MKIRTGFGYDVHKLVEGRELWLGGIKLDYELGLLGHSDADVLIHAICDALLGAANMRDIGYHFPILPPRRLTWTARYCWQRPLTSSPQRDIASEMWMPRYVPSVQSSIPTFRRCSNVWLR